MIIGIFAFINSCTRLMYTLKKSLGQHFLKDESISRKIVQTLCERRFERLVEVGPGGAALTKYLLDIPGVDLKCVEIDDEKVQWLENTYPRLKGKIIHESFLDINQPFEAPFTVIGNFPYNISSQILFKVLEWKESVECVIGMFQKEVAQRIASGPGSKVYGVTSVLMQGFYTIDYLFEVDETSFTPPPKVKSAVIRLVPLTSPVAMKSQRAFFVLVKTAFSQRRKTLRNAVKSLFDPEVLADPFFNQRAEQLSIADFAELTFKMR